MSPSQLLPGLAAPGSGFSDALPYLVAVAAALATGAFGYLGARYTATAPLQTALNDAFRSLMDEFQTARAQSSARISELERENSQQEIEMANLRAQIIGAQQLHGSLVRWCERSGLKVPEQYK